MEQLLKANCNDISFRQALENAKNGDIIKFDRLSCLQSENRIINTTSNTPLVIRTNGAPFIISKSVTVDGSTAHGVDYTEFTTGEDNTYNVFESNAEGASITLKNMFITGGNQHGAINESGVMCMNNIENLTISNVSMTSWPHATCIAYLNGIEDLAVTNSTMRGASTYGLRVYECNRISVTGNVFETYNNGSESGWSVEGQISLSDPTESVEITDNTFTTTSEKDSTPVQLKTNNISSSLTNTLGIYAHTYSDEVSLVIQNNIFQVAYDKSNIYGVWFNQIKANNWNLINAKNNITKSEPDSTLNPNTNEPT